MSTNIPHLFEEALSLPEGERANLAYTLLHSLKPTSVLDEGDPRFDDELQRRLGSYDAGESQASDLDSVANRIRLAMESKKLT